MTGVDGGSWVGSTKAPNGKLQSARSRSKMRGHVGSALCFVYGFREEKLFYGNGALKSGQVDQWNLDRNEPDISGYYN